MLRSARESTAPAVPREPALHVHRRSSQRQGQLLGTLGAAPPVPSQLLAEFGAATSGQCRMLCYNTSIEIADAFSCARATRACEMHQRANPGKPRSRHESTFPAVADTVVYAQTELRQRCGRPAHPGTGGAYPGAGDQCRTAARPGSAGAGGCSRGDGRVAAAEILTTPARTRAAARACSTGKFQQQRLQSGHQPDSERRLQPSLAGSGRLPTQRLSAGWRRPAQRAGPEAGRERDIDVVQYR